jgi:hypothetical protein
MIAPARARLGCATYGMTLLHIATQGKDSMKTEVSIETTMAYQELKKLQVGEICSYETLRGVIDKDPQAEGYPYVKSARRMVERELQCVLEAVINQGIRRLPPRDVVNRGGRDLRHVRKSIGRGMRRQVTIVPIEQNGELNNEERVKFHTQLSQFGILRHVMKPAATNAIEQKVAEASRSIPAKETLKLFAAPATKASSTKPSNDGMVKL